MWETLVEHRSNVRINNNTFVKHVKQHFQRGQASTELEIDN